MRTQYFTKIRKTDSKSKIKSDFAAINDARSGMDGRTDNKIHQFFLRTSKY